MFRRRRLISEFFDRLAVDLRSGRPAHYAQALREARRHVRQQPAWATPRYSAPFVLIGPASRRDGRAGRRANGVGASWHQRPLNSLARGS